jgi:hypothetical protein
LEVGISGVLKPEHLSRQKFILQKAEVFHAQFSMVQRRFIF